MKSIGKDWVETHIDSNGECIIPDGVEKIEEEAFSDNKIVKKVVMPDSIVEIGKSAFKNCSNLQEINFSNNIKEIPYSAFNKCTSLSDIQLPENLEQVGVAAFRNCKNLKHVKFGDKIKSIGKISFEGSGIEQIELPSSLEKIKNGAFGRTAIKEFKIPNQITTIYEGVFGQNPELSSITLNAELDFLDEGAFGLCNNLQEINIEGTQRIKYGAFMNNPNVKKINIDGKEVVLADNEHLFSLQKSNNKVVIVVQDEKEKFCTKAINLEEQSSKTIEGANVYLTEDGKVCHAVNSIADVSLDELKRWKKSGMESLSKLYIYGGDNKVRISEHEKGMNFNLYELDDLISIKTKIEEIKRQVKIPNEQDKNREKKIYGQIVRLLSENIEYDYWGAGSSKEKYERMTRKKF